MKQHAQKFLTYLKADPNRLRILGGILIVIGVGIVFQLNSAKGAAYTWDGGGSDGTCGGVAGDGNKWSCNLNWSSDIVPTSTDTVTFDGTSTKNATISSAVDVAGWTIASGYSGTITQSGATAITVRASGFNQAAGTFTGGSGTFTILSGGNFTLSGGTFTSTSGTLSAPKDWTHTAGGTFNHNSGTVTFTSAGATNTWDVATSETFNNFSISVGGGVVLTVATGDTLVVLGTFTHNGGSFATGTIEARGPVTVGSTSVQGNSPGTLSFLVAGDQVVTGNGGATANVLISKPSGTVSVTGDQTFNGLTLSGGTFTSTTGTLTIRNNWTHTAGGTFNHNSGTVVARGAGSMTWDVTTSETFNNFTTNLDAGVVFTVASGDTLVVLGTFDQTGAGRVNTGTIEPRANMTTNATGASGTGTISFLTTGAQTITATGSVQIPNLNIAKASGTVTLSGSVTLASFNQSSGGFTGGSGSITDSGTFTLSGGTFTSTTGNLSITGAFTHTAGGTFTHNSGTVTITVANATTTTWDVATSDTFNHLTVSNSNGSNSVLAISSGDTLIVTGTFTHTTGVINTGTIEVRGGMTVGATGGIGSATISFLVSGDQTITSSGGSTGGLSINKSSGTVSIASGANLSVYSIAIASGSFTTTSGTLTVAPGGTANSWTHTAGGTFNHNNGTVVFSQSSNTQTIDVAVTETFYNLTVNGQDVNRHVTITAGDTLIATNTFTHTNASLNTGVIDARGNVVIGASAPGGSATIMFAEAGDQTITGNNGQTVSILINKPSGTVSAGSTDLRTRTFTIQSGTFTSTSGTFTVTDAGWNHLGGIFNPNNGTVNIANTNITGGIGGVPIHVPFGETFYNLTYNGSDVNRDLVFTAGHKAIVLNTLTLTNGQVQNGTLEARGNVVVGSSYDGGSTALVFAGEAANQTFNLSGAEAMFDGDVTVQKGAGKVTLQTGLTMDAASQDLTITAGTFDLGTANIVTVSGSSGIVAIGTNGVLLGMGTGGSLILGVNVTNNGTVSLNSNGPSCGDADSIQLRSSVGGVQRTWSGSGKFVIADVDVRDQGGSATIVANSSTSISGNGANWTFNNNCPPTVTAPNGGQAWAVRTTQSITFDAYSGADHYRLFYSTDGGASWTQIATTSSSPYSWTVPVVGTTRGRIMVAAENSGNTVLAQDISDADFTITTYGTTVNGGVIINGGVLVQ